MKVGIIAEGRSDLAVITNLLKGKLNIPQSDIQYLVPEFDYDETTLHQMRIEQFSNWTIVKQSCQNRHKISDFIDVFESERFIVIHIDSDTRQEVGYDVAEPINLNTSNDVICLRENIALKLTEWLGEEYKDKIVYAIAIQEIDAWVITQFVETIDTDLLSNPKDRLFRRILNEPNRFTARERREIFGLNNDKYQQYKLLTVGFRKQAKLRTFIDKNISLRAFCTELERFN